MNKLAYFLSVMIIAYCFESGWQSLVGCIALLLSQFCAINEVLKEETPH